MDMDVARICYHNTELILEEMLIVRNVEDLESMYEEAKDSMFSFFEAIKSRLERGAYNGN